MEFIDIIIDLLRLKIKFKNFKWKVFYNSTFWFHKDLRYKLRKDPYIKYIPFDSIRLMIN
jgi:hypothetical protein